MRALVILPATVLAVGASSGTAAAHLVGTPETPSCFGERMHHANADHKMLAEDRVGGLQEIVDLGFPEAVALFGEVVTVREMDFVRTNCSGTPYVPS